MDEIDFRLCLLLRENSRIPYRELADKVELSVNAVHSRIGNLIDSGIIGGFHTNLGDGAIDKSFRIMIHGESRFDDLDGVIEEISQDENTFKIVSTSDDYLYIHGILPDISDMSDYVEYIPEVAGIDKPEVFLPSVHKTSSHNNLELKRTDYEIIYSLYEDSRKSLSQVADELNVSTKTVRRRIDMMEDNGAIDYNIRWYPIFSDDFIGLLHGKVLDGKRDQRLFEIKNNHFPNVFEVEKASNHPDKVLIKIWASTLDKLQNIRSELRSKEYFGSVKTRLFYDVEYFITWKDELLKEKAKC